MLFNIENGNQVKIFRFRVPLSYSRYTILSLKHPSSKTTFLITKRTKFFKIAAPIKRGPGETLLFINMGLYSVSTTPPHRSSSIHV
jgi:hypothetical protein